MSKLVQCGWCPMILANQHEVWYLHFAEVHHCADGTYSVRYIQGDDWDMAELSEQPK